MARAQRQMLELRKVIGEANSYNDVIENMLTQAKLSLGTRFMTKLNREVRDILGTTGTVNLNTIHKDLIEFRKVMITEKLKSFGKTKGEVAAVMKDYENLVNTVITGFWAEVSTKAQQHIQSMQPSNLTVASTTPQQQLAQAT